VKLGAAVLLELGPASAAMLPLRLILRVGRVAGLLLERPPNKSTGEDTARLGRLW
jgi:hypothetical protein